MLRVYANIFLSRRNTLAFCSFSSKLSIQGYTVIDNAFLNEFLPLATGDDVKVYLYCLNLCSNPGIEDNNLDTISKTLSLTEEQVKNSFVYWQEMGLVQIVSSNPFEVKFLPVSVRSGSNKIRNPEKYAGFNEQMNSIISGRMITPTEFNEYYSLIETYHFEPDALLLIAKYCTKIKSTSIGYPYILTVARNFASEGLKTFESIEKKFIEQEKSSTEIKQILSALGIKREADLDERNLYLKWTENYGFTQGAILEVAKTQKKRGGFARLDDALSKYYEQKLFSISEIQNYSLICETLFETAKEICKIIGVYYQNYENVVDTYISDWYNKGYEKDTLIYIAQNYCFKQQLRTLEGMNMVIQKFYKLGLISFEAIEQYVGEIIQNDELIRAVLDCFGLLRLINSADREMYKTWTNNWDFSQSQILLVAQFAKQNGYNYPYMNKLLSSVFSSGKKTDAEISEFLNNYRGGSKISSSAIKNSEKDAYITRNYTAEELAAVVDSLDDVEL